MTEEKEYEDLPDFILNDAENESDANSKALFSAGSSVATGFTQLASIIGPGALAVPFGIKCFGAVTGCLVLLLSALSAYFTCCLLLKCVAPARRRNSPLLSSTGCVHPEGSYANLAETLCGPKMRALADVGIIGSCFGSLVGTLHVVMTVVPGIFWETAWQGHWFIVLVAALLVLPLSMAEELNHWGIRYAAFLCFAANLFTYVMIGLRFFFGHYVKDWPDVLDDLALMSSSQLWLNTAAPEEMIRAMPIFAQIFNAHWALLPLFTELRDPSRGRMLHVTQKSLSITSLLYLWGGLLGFLIWLDKTQSNVLLEFSKDDELITACRFVVTLAAVCTCPSLVIVLRQNLYHCIQRIGMCDDKLVQSARTVGWNSNNLFKVVCTAAIMIASVIATICVPGLDVAFGLTGSLTATIIIYIIPSTLFLSLDSSDESLGISTTSRILARICQIWGILMGVVCSVYIIATNV